MIEYVAELLERLAGDEQAQDELLMALDVIVERQMDELRRELPVPCFL